MPDGLTITQSVHASSLHSDICSQSATALLTAFRSRALSPVDVAEATLGRIRALNPILNAFFLIDEDGVLEAARASEKRWMKDEPIGPLDGVPVSIKDSIALAGTPMYRGSDAYAGALSAADAPPSARLKEAGAIVLGKTTMPDLGCLASGLSSKHGTTRNPWNIACNTGGSTSGGAAAVAACLGPLTVGTDLGGSVRIPAAYCGLAGFKPTQGYIPHLPASTMRSAGPLARSMADLQLMTGVLSRPDARDYFSFPAEAIGPPPAEPIQGARIGLVLDMGSGVPVAPDIADAIGKAAELLASQGARVTPLPALLRDDPEPAVEGYFQVKTLYELNGIAAERRHLVHPDVYGWCNAAAEASAADLTAAMAGLDRLRAEITAAFSDFDFLISPTMPISAYSADIAFPHADRPWSHLHFTFAYNQTQQPAISIPCGLDSQGMPVGLQIVGRRFADSHVLALAAAFERIRPPLPPFPFLH